MAKEEKREDADERKGGRQPEWLVMIYLAGDNNLSANTIAIMQELEDALSDDDVRVVACFDPNTPRPRGARYLEINFRRKHHPNPHMDWALHDDLVPFDDLPGHPVQAPDFCNTNPSAGRRPTEPTAKEGLSRFIEFALKHHRAKKQMLILFGHGSAVAGNTFLADSTPPSFLRLKEFREVLGRHFSTADAAGEDKRPKPALDILACDNCMMNGIESAYEIREYVKYVVGSQGLVLALGWPFRKILNKVVRYRKDDPARMAERILRVCARNLIDFSLMDRSSEQSLCDLTTFGRKQNVVTAVKRLSAALQKGLAYDRCGDARYPAVRDAVRLARLEAQSYWSETFVDLYDFCALLLERSTAALSQVFTLFEQARLAALSGRKRGDDEEGSDIDLRHFPPMKEFREIARASWDVLEAIKANQGDPGDRKKHPFVLASYYVGSASQYSNGVSIYFPWTLPEDPIIFEPVSGGGGGRYGVSWVGFDRVVAAQLKGGAQDPPQQFELKTAFDEYKEYEFATRDGGDWAAFLTAFFRATLRDVRRFDLKYKPVDEFDRFFDIGSVEDKLDLLLTPSPVNLQKSGSDVDSESDCACPTIKNYPRRFYLSPADCLRRCDLPRKDEKCHENLGERDKKVCVSYLGWNVRGLVAQAIKLKERKASPSEAGDEDFDDEPEGS